MSWGARVAVIVALGALVIRCAFALQPLERLDRLFIPDDTYYTAAIARSLARGTGPAADGLTISNGFQPLLAFLAVPIFRIGVDGETAVSLMVLLTAVFDAASVFLLFRVSRRTWGDVAGIASAMLWAISPYAIANALGGLETSISLFLVLLLVDCFAGPMTVRRGAACGAVAGLAWLARVDTIALTALVFVAILRRKAAVRTFFAAIATFLLILGPWWGYQLIHFHTIVPQSGAAVRAQVGFHRALYLTEAKQASWSIGYLSTAPFGESRWWRNTLFVNPDLGLLLFAATVVLAAIWLYRALHKSENVTPVQLLCAFAVIVMVFYTFYVPALWFFRRYLAPAELAAALIWSGVIANFQSSRIWWRRGVAGGLCLMALVWSVLTLTSWWRLEPQSLDTGLEGAKGYREPALTFMAVIPPNAVVGAFQSGALTYFARPSVTVVNLDGVVDPAAHRASEAGLLRDYAKARGVQWFADWPFNLQAFDFFSQRAATPPPAATEVVRGPYRGLDQAILWRLEWQRSR